MLASGIQQRNVDIRDRRGNKGCPPPAGCRDSVHGIAELKFVGQRRADDGGDIGCDGPSVGGREERREAEIVARVGSSVRHVLRLLAVQTADEEAPFSLRVVVDAIDLVVRRLAAGNLRLVVVAGLAEGVRQRQPIQNRGSVLAEARGRDELLPGKACPAGWRRGAGERIVDGLQDAGRVAGVGEIAVLVGPRWER